MQDACGLYYAQMKLSPFTKGENQLSKLDVDFAHQLSHVHIYLEWVNGFLRQKNINTTINMIIYVCNSELSFICN